MRRGCGMPDDVKAFRRGTAVSRDAARMESRSREGCREEKDGRRTMSAMYVARPHSQTRTFCVQLVCERHTTLPWLLVWRSWSGPFLA